MNMPAGYFTLSHVTSELHPSLAEVSPHNIWSGPLKKLLICCGKVKPFDEALEVQESTAAFHPSLVSTASQRSFGAIEASAISGLVHGAVSKEALGAAAPCAAAAEGFTAAEALETAACGAGAGAAAVRSI